MAGTADDRGEHGPGGIVSGEASLHQAGAVVAHKGGSLIVVTHVGFCKRGEEDKIFEFKSHQIHNVCDRNELHSKALINSIIILYSHPTCG